MSFSAYPAYKDSDVEWLGEVPKHWILTPLKHLALLNPRKSGYDGDMEQLCSFVPMEKLKNGVVQLDEERPIKEVIGGYTYFEDGDVLQAKVTPCFENKNVAIAKGLINGIGFGSSEINVLRPYNGFNAEYLYYRVQEDSYMDFCTSSMIGAGGLKRVPTDVINNFVVATPEFFEQTQIAKFLDYETARIDALIEEQQRLIKLLKEKRQAVISHAVTKGLDPTVPMKDSGVEWLGEVPAHWVVGGLKWFWSVTDCKHVTAEFVDCGIPLASIREVQNRYVALVDAKQTTEVFYRQLIEAGRKPAAGDLIFSRNATVGEVAQVADWHPPFAMGQDVCLLKKQFDWLSSDYLQAVLRSPVVMVQLDTLMIGSTFKRVNVEDIRGLTVPMPPQDEQKLIAEYLSRETGVFDSLLSEAQTTVVLLQERRSALISAAVTGKIDVRGWKPPISALSRELAEEAV
jgi:type I restriction enzyme S subunit